MLNDSCKYCNNYKNEKCIPKFKIKKFGNVYLHTIEVLKHAPNTTVMQFSALLHDIGKLETFKKVDNEITFHGHEKTGSEKSRLILSGLKFDNSTIEKIVKIINLHMRPLFLSNNGLNGKAIRRFMREADDLLDDILDLAEADAKGSLPVKNHIPELREKISEIILSPNKPSQKAILNGNEIIEILNIKSGKLIGEILQYLLDMQDEYAELNKELTKEEAKISIIEKFVG
jgi:tRNA nucleotidyltransferase/poly(A) polymerase